MRATFLVLLVLLGFGSSAPTAWAVITVSAEDITRASYHDDFNTTQFNYEGTPLTLSDGTKAAALFAGQGAAATPPGVGGNSDLNAIYGGGYGGAWEVVTGAPTPGVSLALQGQPATGPTNNIFQDVWTYKPTGAEGRIYGSLDNTNNGVISFLFQNNINLFSIRLIGSGRNPGDGYGGPMSFQFFDRLGVSLGLFIIPKAVDGPIGFRSSRIDIAGVQILTQDPFGIGYSRMWFGTPAPTSLALMAPGLVVAVWSMRCLRKRPAARHRRWRAAWLRLRSPLSAPVLG